MPEKAVQRPTAARRVYLIIALFVALIIIFLLLIQLQMNALNAVRAYVGGEGVWAKAQKNAVISLEYYAESGDEAAWQAYLQAIEEPLGDRDARIELLKPEPDLDVARAGFRRGSIHPEDVEYVISFFRSFRRTSYMDRALTHWTEGDRLIAEMDEVARALHEEISAGRRNPEMVRSFHAKLFEINRKLSLEEDGFSSSMGEAARWAINVFVKLSFAAALLFAALGVALSLPIVARIRATESALSESEQKFRTITTAAMDAIAMLDDQGRTVFFNEAAEKMFGYSADEVMGRDLHPLVSPSRYLDDYRRTYPHFALTGEGAAIGKVLELAGLRKDGSEFPVELTVSATRIQGKWAAVGIIRDITERKRVEQEVRELNEALQTKVDERTRQLLEAQEELVRKEKLALLGQVAGAVGHELRNPLGVMSNAVFFLQSVLPEADETTREYLNIIRKEIAGSTRIVSDLLDSVRTPMPYPEELGVAEVVAQALSECVVPSRVSVRVDVPPAISSLYADRRQIQMVIGKLVSNAIDAMPEGGNLEVVAREDEAGGTIVLSVKDSGTGIAPEDMPRLFQPLFTTKARGIGLGLVVVKNLTEANDGRVEVLSEPGKGSTFSITLPSKVKGGGEGI